MCLHVSVPSIGSRGIATTLSIFLILTSSLFQYPRSGLGVLLLRGDIRRKRYYVMFQYPRSGLGVLLRASEDRFVEFCLRFQYPRSGLGVLLLYRFLVHYTILNVSVPSIGSRGIATCRSPAPGPLARAVSVPSIGSRGIATRARWRKRIHTRSVSVPSIGSRGIAT